MTPRTVAPARLRSPHGFTLVELVIATGLLLLVVTALLGQAWPADHLFQGQAEAADMQQRLRAAVDTLDRDLAAAGGVAGLRPDDQGVAAFVPVVWPQRIGLRSPDPAGTFRPDVITVLQALPLPAVPTLTAQPTAAADGVTSLAAGPGCPAGDPFCGLAVGDGLLVADGDGAFDLYSVVATTAPAIALRHDTADWNKVYPAGSIAVPVRSRTFYVRPGDDGRPPQLVRYGGGDAADVPVVDHVVSLRFDYFGTPDPPRMRRPLSDSAGPWTTYGPRPPVADRSVTPWIAGDSCLYAANGTAIATPRLPSYGPPDSALVPLAAAQLSDGPWCPDAAAPNRYDADLLRLRSVQVTIRVESALDGLRGPAGALFARAGTARAAARYAPDLEVRTRITLPAAGAWR